MAKSQVNDRGQITIPKDIRDKMELYQKDNVEIKLDSQGRLIITKQDFFDDVLDLIVRELKQEGYEAEELKQMIPVRKHQLSKALEDMAEESSGRVKQGEYVTLDELEKELENQPTQGDA